MEGSIENRYHWYLRPQRLSGRIDSPESGLVMQRGELAHGLNGLKDLVFDEASLREAASTMDYSVANCPRSSPFQNA
jgi:hypothetical protein